MTDSDRTLPADDRTAPADGPTDRPHRLRIDAGGDAFPVAGGPPQLSWWPAARPDAAPGRPAGDLPTRVPAGHDLEAEADGVRLPTAVLGPGHRFVAWPFAGPLASGQRVAWRVRERFDDGPGPWSAWAGFEVGLLDPDWEAAWIGAAETSDPGPGRRPAHELATTFTLPGPVASARLYATALGVYEAFVNGERAGTTELAPGSTSYDRTVHAQAYDVADALHPGRNTLSLVVSDGWFRGQVGAFRHPAAWGDAVAVCAELHVRLADGGRRVLRTGPDWTSRPTTITRADLMDGQTDDLTRSGCGDHGEAAPHAHAGTGGSGAAGDESGAAGDGSGAADAAAGVVVRTGPVPPISWSPAPPVRCVDELPAASLTRVAPDAWVADFGQNASGRVRLARLGEAGVRSTLDFGEHLGRNGDLDTTHLDAREPGRPPIPFVQRDEVVSDGEASAFEPRHTVHGFRYARLTRSGGPEPAAADLALRVVHTDLAPTGEFACGAPDLDRLWRAARWGFRGNAVDVPTDCPTRERLGWTGDYQVFVSTATRLFDVHGFSRKWLASVRDDQLPDGRIANFSPDGRRIKHHLDDRLALMTGSAGWGDAIVHVPWELYRAYGDVGVLAENRDAMAAWVEWALGRARESRHASRAARSPEPQPHEEYLWDGTFHWGEWCEPAPRAADGSRAAEVQTDPMAWFLADKGEVGTAFLHRSVATLAEVSALLGRTGDAERYARIAGLVRDAWRTEFLRPDGRTAGDTQAGYVRGLAFGLIPDGERAAAVARLVELIGRAGGRLATGFLSTGDLLPVLADAGRADVAYDLLFARTPPSWLTMLDRGATTFWEDWEGVDEHGDAHESLNHYSKGAVARFLHSHTLGLRQEEDSAGWDRFVVAPVPDARVPWARGSLLGPQGRIAVAWEATDDGLRVRVEVPPASEATLVFPGGRRVRLGPGVHEHRG
ncbi:family 78 glycoside hydrolase catalytic domain [Propioniciclava coleopterorum]|uniref:alpha-L-rhamnosidase n=1 Tax=Propioniciclava coleopterorum TaxID=2714937 RepID=A0A6G7Y322_9ACTN|nr:family 78 glycoside hydrolase catalytic domain [Propioniciclava coleopterorum]QIK71086.1 family 78 glycoside hydrolase catalytic domain [Propioniciclava coleopterorum]